MCAQDIADAAGPALIKWVRPLAQHIHSCTCGVSHVSTFASSGLTSQAFAGQAGEQWTMFFKDPSGNALEFKAMTNPENLFAKYFVS